MKDSNRNPSSGERSCFHWLVSGFAWLLLGGLTLWAAAALYFDLSFLRPTVLTPPVYLVVIATAAYAAKTRLLRMATFLGGFVVIVTCWLSIKPSNDRPWQAILRERRGRNLTATASPSTISAIATTARKRISRASGLPKLCLFPSFGVSTCSRITGVQSGSCMMLSFQFGDADYVTASIEARYQVGQSYSPVRAFFRQFELVYVLADERDLIRLRTNYRSGEKVYLYHIVASQEWSRLLFLEYLQHANQLRDHPRWFNALTDNCTTNIFSQMAATGHLPAGSSRYAWWILLNGQAPEMLYRAGNFAGNLPFAELQRRAYINPVANTLHDAPDFSRRIRIDRPGFEFLASHDGTPQGSPN